MKFWHATAFLEPAHLTHLARACEDAGFGGIIVSDHVAFPENIESVYPYRDSGLPMWNADTPWIDPWVAIGAMAAVTERIRFSHNVYVFPLRHPVEVAKSAASASVMSGGRVSLGVGVGWMREEFELLGREFRKRGRLTDEGLEVCRALWRGGPVTHHGELFDLDAISMSPTPPGGTIPVLIGGESDAALRRAARNDGWIGTAYPLDAAEAILERLDAALQAEGRKLGDPDFEVLMGLYSLDHDDFRRFADRGVTGFLSAPAMLAGYAAEARGMTASLDDRLRAVAEFGEQIIAPLA